MNLNILFDEILFSEILKYKIMNFNYINIIMVIIFLSFLYLSLFCPPKIKMFYLYILLFCFYNSQYILWKIVDILLKNVVCLEVYS
jgi:hypothetical protein